MQERLVPAMNTWSLPPTAIEDASQGPGAPPCCLGHFDRLQLAVPVPAKQQHPTLRTQQSRVGSRTGLLLQKATASRVASRLYLDQMEREQKREEAQYQQLHGHSGAWHDSIAHQAHQGLQVVPLGAALGHRIDRPSRMPIQASLDSMARPASI